MTKEDYEKVAKYYQEKDGDKIKCLFCRAKLANKKTMKRHMIKNHAQAIRNTLAISRFGR